MTRRHRLGVLGLVAAVVLVAGCGRGGSASPASSDDPPGSATMVSTTVVARPGVTGLPTITRAELPAQAIDTLALIDAGGPFPFERDGAVFQNREGLLPARPLGFYREYTVITPGEPDRGARRIVMGADGVAFSTDDHYDSFAEVVP